MLMGWFLVIMYPNPLHLVFSVYRLYHPPVAPAAVSDYARELEDKTPLEIEQFVYARLPYSYDWEVHSMPWYFPTLNEALNMGAGDCKARFLLFASLMEELDIAYRKHVSLTHIWADYDGKPVTALENSDEVLVAVNEEGFISVNMPSPDFSRAWRSFKQGFWEVMPQGRKYLLFTGIPLIHGLFYMPWLVSFRGRPAFSAASLTRDKSRGQKRFVSPEEKAHALFSFHSIILILFFPFRLFDR